MASIRRLESKGTLFMDFRFGGVRLREYTELADTPAYSGCFDQLFRN